MICLNGSATPLTAGARGSSGGSPGARPASVAASESATRGVPTPAVSGVAGRPT